MFIAADALGSGDLLAHPIAVLAIPAFVPAVVVVGVVLYIARKDRREAEQEAALRSAGNVEPAKSKGSE